MRLLLLAGTAEARQIARGLAREPRLRTVASLAGSARAPAPLGVPTRIGGFGGAAAFRDWLIAERIAGVLDVTHPFTVAISHRSAEICAELGLPYLQFLRPPWLPTAGDRWTFLNDFDATPEHIPPGSTVFLAGGGRAEDWIARLPGRRLILRQDERPMAGFPGLDGRYLVAPAPFDIADAMRLFETHGIEWIVARNSGGASGRAKIDAARHLGLPVAMLRRPKQPEAPKVSTVAAALAWARALAA